MCNFLQFLLTVSLLLPYFLLAPQTFPVIYCFSTELNELPSISCVGYGENVDGYGFESRYAGTYFTSPKYGPNLRTTQPQFS